MGPQATCRVAVGRVLAALALLGCGHEEGPYPECGGDASYAPIEGELRLEYSGWVGSIPKDWIRMHVSTETAENVHLTGCGYDGNGDWWWADLSIRARSTAPRPVGFDSMNPEAAQAGAFLQRCPQGHCVDERRRSWFGHSVVDAVGLEGTLTELDTVSGHVQAELTLTDRSPGTLETGTVHVVAGFSWRPRYEPTIAGAITRRWTLRATPGAPNTSDFEQSFELDQVGYALSGRLCDASFVCDDSDLHGRLADPQISLSWTTPEDREHAFELTVTLAPDARTLSGVVTGGPERGRWQVAGEAHD